MMIRKLPRNASGHDWVVGDLHGCFPMLERLLKIISFNPERDRLLSVGDLIDRGERSPDVLDWLAKPWFHAVRGNHEQMALDAAAGDAVAEERYLRNGGEWLYQQSASVRQACLDAFSRLPFALEVELEGGLVGLLHADCPGNDWPRLRAQLAQGRLDAQEQHFLLWSRERAHGEQSGPVRGVDLLLVGHTPQDGALLRDNVMYMDTGAVYGGKLTLFCLDEFIEVSLPANRNGLAAFQLHESDAGSPFRFP